MLQFPSLLRLSVFALAFCVAGSPQSVQKGEAQQEGAKQKGAPLAWQSDWEKFYEALAPKLAAVAVDGTIDSADFKGKLVTWTGTVRRGGAEIAVGMPLPGRGILKFSDGTEVNGVAEIVLKPAGTNLEAWKALQPGQSLRFRAKISGIVHLKIQIVTMLLVAVEDPEVVP